MPNLETNWMMLNSPQELSAGAAKVLRGITQYPARLFEQCLHTQYKPFLNQGDQHIIFFNFPFSTVDMETSSRTLHRYQALASDQVTVLAEAGSYNELSKLINLSNISVRNNMNWFKGTTFTFNGESVSGYLREFGAPWRQVPVNGQLVPKTKWPTLHELSTGTIYDLEPGKVFAINVDTMETFMRPFDSLRDLWLTLNPNKVADFQELSSSKQHETLSNLVGRHLNVLRPNGTETDLGYFYFARHPDHLPGLAKGATSLFRINVDDGLATWFANNSAVDRHNRLTVRNCIKN